MIHVKNNDTNTFNEILDTKKPINNWYEDQLERKVKLIKITMRMGQNQRPRCPGGKQSYQSCLSQNQGKIR